MVQPDVALVVAAPSVRPATAMKARGGKLQVRALPDGPLIVNGRFAIRTGAGRVAWRGVKAAPCRCGASKNEPFRHASHEEAGLEAE